MTKAIPYTIRRLQTNHVEVTAAALVLGDRDVRLMGPVGHPLLKPFGKRQDIITTPTIADYAQSTWPSGENETHAS